MDAPGALLLDADETSGELRRYTERFEHRPCENQVPFSSEGILFLRAFRAALTNAGAIENSSTRRIGRSRVPRTTRW
jgi:hypothetical protein